MSDDAASDMRWNRDQSIWLQLKEAETPEAWQVMFDQLSPGMKRRVIDEQFDRQHEDLWKRFRSDKQDLDKAKQDRLKELGLVVL